MRGCKLAHACFPAHDLTSQGIDVHQDQAGGPSVNPKTLISSTIAEICETNQGHMYTFKRKPYSTIFCLAFQFRNQIWTVLIWNVILKKSIKLKFLPICFPLRLKPKLKKSLYTSHCEIGLVQNPFTVSGKNLVFFVYLIYLYIFKTRMFIHKKIRKYLQNGNHHNHLVICNRHSVNNV